MSPAYLFRRIGADVGLPTLLVDEVDALFNGKSQSAEEIRGLLNAGHRRGAMVGRCVIQGKTITTEESPAYCAVALAGLGFLPDTLMTRSVVIRMRRRAPSEHVEPFRHRDHCGHGEFLQDRLATWAAPLVETVAAARPVMPKGIEDRAADCWEPLLAIADAAGGHWPEIARVAAVALVAASREANPSLGIRLLEDIRIAFQSDYKLSTEQLIHRLIELPESSWTNLKGKPLDDRGLAARLRKYEVRPKTIRIGNQTPRGYERADFEDSRSLPRRPNEQNIRNKHNRVLDVLVVLLPGEAGGTDQEELLAPGGATALAISSEESLTPSDRSDTSPIIDAQGRTRCVDLRTCPSGRPRGGGTTSPSTSSWGGKLTPMPREIFGSYTTVAVRNGMVYCRK
jgi:hypothetical protein